MRVGQTGGLGSFSTPSEAGSCCMGPGAGAGVAATSNSGTGFARTRRCYLLRSSSWDHRSRGRSYTKQGRQLAAQALLGLLKSLLSKMVVEAKPRVNRDPRDETVVNEETLAGQG